MNEDLKLLLKLYLFLQIVLVIIAIIYGNDIMIVSPYLSEMTAEKMDLYASPDFSIQMANPYVYYAISGINALALILMAAGLYNLIGNKEKRSKFQAKIWIVIILVYMIAGTIILSFFRSFIVHYRVCMSLVPAECILLMMFTLIYFSYRCETDKK